MDQMMKAYATAQVSQQKNSMEKMASQKKDNAFEKTLKEQMGGTTAPKEETAPPKTSEKHEDDTKEIEEEKEKKPVPQEEDALLTLMAMAQNTPVTVSQKDMEALLGNKPAVSHVMEIAPTADVVTEQPLAEPVVAEMPVQQPQTENVQVQTPKAGETQPIEQTLPMTENAPATQVSPENPLQQAQTTSRVAQPMTTQEKPIAEAPKVEQPDILPKEKQVNPTGVTKVVETPLPEQEIAQKVTAPKAKAEETEKPENSTSLPQLPQQEKVAKEQPKQQTEQDTKKESSAPLPEKEKNRIEKSDFSTDYLRSIQDKFAPVAPTATPVPQEPVIPLTPLETAQVRAANVPAQIANSLPANLLQGAQEFEIQLEPEFLGKMTIKMVLENQKLSLEFIAHTQKGEAAIRQGITQLEQAFRGQDIQVDRISVTYDAFNNLNSSQDGQNSSLFQKEQQNSQHQQRNHFAGGDSRMGEQQSATQQITIEEQIARMSALNYRV